MFQWPSTIEHVAFVFICKIVPGSSSTSVGNTCPLSSMEEIEVLTNLNILEFGNYRTKSNLTSKPYLLINRIHNVQVSRLPR